jgi:hypothetical protein
MNFHPVNQIDERFINKEPVVPMIRGAQSVSKNTVQVVGQPNTSNLNWNFPITSGVCTDLDWYGTYVLNFSILVTNNTGAPIAQNSKLLTYGTNMCVADYPVASLITNLNCKLNEQQLMNYNVSDYKNMLLRLGDHNKVVGEAVCPAMIETGFANYNDSYLTRNNPMASYSDASFGSGEIPNGAWGAICAIDPVSNNVAAPGGLADGNAQPVSVTVTINEPIVSAPFLFQHLQKHSEASPYYLRNVIINMALSTVASRFFRFGGPDITPAGVPGKTITSVTLTSVSSALINYFTLSAPLVKGFSLPEKSVIKAFDIVTSSVVGTPFAAGTSTKKLTLSNQSLSGLPRYIVLGCRPELNAYDPTNATWYYPIQTLTVTLGNNQNILAEYNIVDLYRASVRNGLKQDYISFSGVGSSIAFASAPVGGGVTVAASKPVQTCSSPIILEIGEDITLPFDVVNGSQGNFNFTFNVVCLNTEKPNAAGVGQGTNAPSLFFMALYDTYFSTDSKTLMSSIARSLISPDLALEVKENVQEHEVPQSADSEVGGALNKMKSAGYANNVSKSSAVSRLSKRLVH